MTEAEVLALINAAIVANGNNEITANVLRPILVAMLEQPNDKVGELVDLDTTDKSNIVNAINEILNTASTTFEIHSGANNPNTTPPASYSIGDWYIRSGSSIYQFNGDAWILLSSSNTISDEETFTADAGLNSFVLSTTPVNVTVWVEGVYQYETTDYTLVGNTVSILYNLTLNDRVVVRKYEQNISGAISKPPIQDTYDDLDALVAGQGSQLQGYVYRVLDGSTVDASITGELWVNYLGTITGTTADYSWEPRPSGGGGSGDVVGPASAVDGDIAIFDSTTGKLIKAADTSAGTGTAIALSLTGRYYNTATPSTATTYTITGATQIGAWARARSSDATASEPTVTGATNEGGVEWQAGVEYDIFIVRDDEGVKFSFIPTETTIPIGDRLEEDLTVTGTKNIDWDLYETFRFTLTGNCTFSDVNLPTTGSKAITIYMDGAFTPTWAAGWTTYISGSYNTAELNTIVAEYVKATTPFWKVQISQPD